MKRLINLSIAMLVFSFFATTAFAQSKNMDQNRNQFKNTTSQFGNSQRANWVDANGDGICDNFGTVKQGNGNGHGYGLRDGSGAGVKPQDGTGYGRKNGAGMGIQNNKNSNGSGIGFGTGLCNGSGPKGNSRRNGQRRN
jgi:hypothetical protein